MSSPAPALAAPDGDMLATGTAADAQGVGIPALISEWPYLVEVLGALIRNVEELALALRYFGVTGEGSME